MKKGCQTGKKGALIVKVNMLREENSKLWQQWNSKLKPPYKIKYINYGIDVQILLAKS